MRLGKIRMPVRLLALVVMAPACSPFGDGLGTKPGSELPEAVETHTQEVSGTVEAQSSTLEELKAHYARESPPPWLNARAGGDELSGNIAVSNFEDSRLLAVRPSFLVEAAKKGSATQFEILRVSPVVGATYVVRQVGSDLIIAPTNHAELVRMKPDWKTLDTLELAEVLGAKGLSDYGTVLEHKGSLFVTVEFVVQIGEPQVAVLEVDPIRWVEKKHRSYLDRFNAPKGCITSDGQIALVSRSVPDPPSAPVLDFIDPVSLDRRRSVTINSTGDVECIGNTVWVSNFNTPTGEVFSVDGERVGTFEWKGRGSHYIQYSASHGRLFGSDQVRGFLFACDIKSRACRSGPVIKARSKPTSFVVIGDKIFLNLESAQSIAVLDAASLRSLGTVGFPGSYGFAGTPLAMTVLR